MGMNFVERMGRMQSAVVDVLGLRLKDVVGFDERVRNVRATATIGMLVGAVFSVFNILTPGMLSLGLTELAAVVFFWARPRGSVATRSRWAMRRR